MVEFYYSFFPKNYKAKILQLIVDIEKLLTIEKVEIIQDYQIVYNEKYNLNLNDKQWQKLNQLIWTQFRDGKCRL